MLSQLPFSRIPRFLLYLVYNIPLARAIESAVKGTLLLGNNKGTGDRVVRFLIETKMKRRILKADV